MAKVLLLLAVILSVEQVFSDRTSSQNVQSCDECIRIGGYWCKDPSMEFMSDHCVDGRTDTWCPGHREVLPRINEQVEGNLLSVKYSQRLLTAAFGDDFTIKYKAAAEPMVSAIVVKTTQTNETRIQQETECKNHQCSTTIQAQLGTNFCLPTGGASESFAVEVSVEGIPEIATIDYIVPCACPCSEKVEINSTSCNGRGNFSCGVCTCQDGWSGKNCDRCESNRGDLRCTHDIRTKVMCSGNGKCDSCDNCVCFTTGYGSQYFDPKDYCADICLTTSSYCDHCLRNVSLGRCAGCSYPLINQPYNETLTKERNINNQSIWINCNETFESGYNVEYFVMRDERGDSYFMIVDNTPVNAAIGGGGVDVTPIILGVLGVILAGAAVAGYVVWKNRLPALPLADPVYTNIDAVDSTGVNPLYKSPTSSFKNPTYGKW